MNKLSLRITIPIVLAGLLAIVVFAALDYEGLRLSYLVVFLLLIICIFFFGFYVGQDVSQPIKKLLERTIELRRGNLNSRFYLESRDEIGELARAFNEIAEELQESQCANEKTEKSVDIKVRARTQALEETINALEQKIKNRTIELERLMKDSERIQQEARAREKDAVSLKKELNALKLKTGRYKSKI